MKKATLIIAAAFVMLFAGNAQAQLGINIGYAPQTTTSVVNSKSTSSNMDGIFAGVNYNHTLSGNIGLSFGAQVRYNFKTTTNTILSATQTTKNTQFLVDVPVLFNFAIPMGKDAQIAIFAGPVFSLALKGNTNISENVLNTSNDYNWYGENSNNSQFDLMGAVGVAFDFQAFRIFGGYRLGFVDLNKSDNVKETTSGIFAGLGYTL